MLVVLAVTCAGAALSYWLIEAPVRRRKALAPAVLVCCVGAAISAYAVKGINNSEDVSGLGEVAWAGNLYNVAPRKEWPEHVRRRMRGVTLLDAGGEGEPAVHAGSGVVRRYGGDAVDLLVLGDSHGLMWAPAIDEVARELGLTVSFMTAEGTSPFVAARGENIAAGSPYFSAGEMQEFNDARLALLGRRPRLVLIAARWRDIRVSDASSFLRLARDAGSRVLLVEGPPVLGIGNRNVLQYLAFLGVRIDADGRAWIESESVGEGLRAANVVKEILGACGGWCEMVPVNDLYRGREGGQIKVAEGARVLYMDDDHLSVAGAMLAVPRLLRSVKEGLRDSQSAGHGKGAMALATRTSS